MANNATTPKPAAAAADKNVTKTKIKLNTSYAGLKFQHRPGAEIEVHPDAAQRFIDAGEAVAVVPTEPAVAR